MTFNNDFRDPGGRALTEFPSGQRSNLSEALMILLMLAATVAMLVLGSVFLDGTAH